MMDRLLNIVKESLVAVDNPRFYKTERGFQGAFLAELSRRLPSLRWEGAIIEQEYQKRILPHGLRIRPDIIIHVPFEEGHHNSRREGNFVVFELKLNATVEKAMYDYSNLSSMCEVLDYPLGIFINIGSDNAFLKEFQGACKERLHAFSVFLEGTRVRVRDEYVT